MNVIGQRYSLKFRLKCIVTYLSKPYIGYTTSFIVYINFYNVFGIDEIVLK